jgi:hypothetical protein
MKHDSPHAPGCRRAPLSSGRGFEDTCNLMGPEGYLCDQHHACRYPMSLAPTKIVRWVRAKKEGTGSGRHTGVRAAPDRAGEEDKGLGET